MKKQTRGGWRYYIVTRHEGRKVYHPGGYANRRDAQAALNKLKVSKDENTYRPPDTETVRSFLASWASSHKGLRPRTRLLYEQVIRDHINPVIGDLRVQRVGPEDVQRVIDTVEPKVGTDTVLKVASVMRAAFAVAVRRGRLPRNPASTQSGVLLPRRARSKIQPPLPEDIDRILKVAEGYPMYLPVVICAWTGLRRGETLALRWSDIDLNAGELHVRRAATFTDREVIFAEPKSDRALRTVPLRPQLVALLRKAKVEQDERRLALGIGWRDNDLVVDDGFGQPVHPERLSRFFRMRARRVGLDHHLHELRHTFASALLSQGVPIFTVSRIMGHASAAFTQDVYGHLQPGDPDTVRDALARAYGGEV